MNFKEDRDIKILRSIVSERSILDIVSRDYNLKNVIECNLIKACGSNDIYELKTAQTRYILKLYSVRKCWNYNRDHYLFELNLQKFLSDQEILVPIPIVNRNNLLINEIKTPEYKKYYALYSYLDGKLWNHSAKNNDDRPYILGKALANLHIMAKNHTPNNHYIRILDLDFLVKKPYERIKHFASYTKHSRLFLNKVNEFVNQLECSLKQIDFYSLQYGIIHGDMHLFNHFYLKKNQKILFFDFELCGYGYYIYDLAVLKWSLLLHKKRSADSIMKRILNGYLSVNSLLGKELDLINTFIKIRHLFILGSSIIEYPETPQFYNSNLCLEYLKRIVIE